jgi:hypothetical protein
VNPLQIIWALGLIACVVGFAEQIRGTSLAPREEKLRLRALWRGWPVGAYAQLAFHDVSEPTRTRLRRGAWALVLFLACWTVGMISLGDVWWLAAPGVLGGGVVLWALLRR